MAIDRVTINLPEGQAALLEQRAAEEKRSVSNYIGVLIENDLKAAGLLECDKKAEILAAAAELGEEKTLEILRRAARRTKEPAQA